jgi:hypothetical protein
MNNKPVLRLINLPRGVSLAALLLYAFAARDWFKNLGALNAQTCAKTC